MQKAFRLALKFHDYRIITQANKTEAIFEHKRKKRNELAFWKKSLRKKMHQIILDGIQRWNR